MEIALLIEDSIREQFSANNKTNLFYKGLNISSHFLPKTRELLTGHRSELLALNNSKAPSSWIALMTDLSFKTFCQSNQFLDLRAKDRETLYCLYEALWNDILAELQRPEIDFECLQREHLRRLSDWIIATNSFIRFINSPEDREIADVVCAEYSANLQMDLLKIDLNTISEPILDIGCGEHATLVSWLRQQGKETFGLDRLLNAGSPHLLQGNWLEYAFGEERWGTITANNSFSLHFLHQHRRQEGNISEYAAKFMEILRSLKQGGVFYYAPALPFIEQYLPGDKYTVENGNTGSSFLWTKIRKS